MAGNHALHDETVSAAVTEAMVAMHERYYGRAPAAAKSLMMGDDLLACVLGGVYPEVEKTMIELAAPFRRRCNVGSSPPSRR